VSKASIYNIIERGRRADMEADLYECELLKKQLKKEEAMLVGKAHATGGEGVVMNDHAKLRYFDKILHPKSSPHRKLLEKIDFLKDSKEDRMHVYFNKIIKNILNGKLDLH
jgi:hypothetical protein